MSQTTAFDEPLLTLSDLIVRIGDRNGMSVGDTRMQRMIQRAIRDALRDLPSRSNWRYYDRNFVLQTSAPVTLAVTYVNSTKTATVTTGTIPSDGVFGDLLIGDQSSRIESITGAAIKLQEATGVDFTGDVTWSRSTYQIPKIAAMRRLFRNDNRQEVHNLSNEMLSTWNLSYNAPGTPIYYALRQDSQTGANDIVLTPPPSGSVRYTASASTSPPYPSIAQDFATASGTSGAATFISPEAKPSWVGAVVRSAQASTGKQESLLYAEYEWQSTIVSVSGTTVTVKSTLPAAFSNETILVSSLIDIAIGPMQTYFEAMCHEYYCRNHKHDGLANAIAVSARLYLEARGADSQVDKSSVMWMGAAYPWVINDLEYATIA